jgi:hypothetical protein
VIHVSSDIRARAFDQDFLCVPPSFGAARHISLRDQLIRLRMVMSFAYGLLVCWRTIRITAAGRYSAESQPIIIIIIHLIDHLVKSREYILTSSVLHVENKPSMHAISTFGTGKGTAFQPK